jgi:hypothetical protein
MLKSFARGACRVRCAEALFLSLSEIADQSAGCKPHENPGQLILVVTGIPALTYCCIYATITQFCLQTYHTLAGTDFSVSLFMKLQIFTKDVRDEWISQGYDSVKIIASDRLSVNDEPDPFFLLEPYSKEIDIGDESIVQNIGSPTVEEIILKQTGRYYR